MNPRQTWSLLFAAGVLFLVIYFLERGRPQTSGLLIPQLDPRAIEALDISYATNATAVSLLRTNGQWELRQSRYPAQATPVEQITEQLATLKSYDKIPANDAFIQGLPAFGLEPPVARLILRTATNQLEVQFGKRTPLTNHVYARISGDTSVYVTDATVLQLLPANRDALREKSILHLGKNLFDTLQIRSGQRIVELQRNATNAQWQITRPIPARADQVRVSLLLDQLERSQATAFVSDSPAAEAEKYGLQTPAVELLFLRGSNQVGRLAFGRTLTNEPGLVYAQVPVFSNVVVTTRALAESLNQPYKSFHDARLVHFPLTNLSRIEIRAFEQFALERDSAQRWQVAATNLFPADQQLVTQFLTNLASLQILDIARELPTETDLKAFGFGKPVATYALFSAQTNASGVSTNILLTQLEYGSNQVDTIFVRRTDEVPIYVGSLGEMLDLPRRGFELRDRQIWTWQGTNIISVGVSNSTQGITIKRNEKGDWSEDSVTNAALEEMIHRLATVKAGSWVVRGQERLRSYGLAASQFVFTMVDRAGTERRISFGNMTMRKDVYAATVLPGETEPVIFEFPGFLYQDLLRTFTASSQ